MDLDRLDSETAFMGKSEYVGRGQDRKGIHGVYHWRRVKKIGLELAESTGADKAVIIAFANLHDSARNDDGEDLAHGPRASSMVYNESHREPLASLDMRQINVLGVAIRDHSRGFTVVPEPWTSQLTKDEETTILTCWDADRLDLWRVGVVPDPARLCTDAARDHLAKYEETNREKYPHLFN